MSKVAKFRIGQKVAALVSRRGSYEPSMCHVGEEFTISKVELRGDKFYYTCGYDGYEFEESELKKAR